MKKAGHRGKTFLEQQHGDHPGVAELVKLWNDALTQKLLGHVWEAYDRLGYHSICALYQMKKKPCTLPNFAAITSSSRLGARGKHVAILLLLRTVSDRQVATTHYPSLIPAHPPPPLPRALQLPVAPSPALAWHATP